MSDFLNRVTNHRVFPGEFPLVDEDIVHFVDQTAGDVAAAIMKSDEGIASFIKELREAGDPDFSGEADMFQPYNIPLDASVSLSNAQLAIPSGIRRLLHLDQSGEVTKLLSEQAEIFLPEGPIFESLGATVILKDDETSGWNLDYTGYDGNIIGTDTLSDVVKVYDENRLKRMALEKAKLHQVVQSIAGMFPENNALQRQLYQAVVTILSGGLQQYKGSHSIGDKIVAVSGSETFSHVKEKMLEKYDPCDTITYPMLDEIAPIKADKNGVAVGRVDLLAGHFDELQARLTLHDPQDWPEQVRIFLEDMKHHFRQSQMEKDPYAVGILC